MTTQQLNTLSRHVHTYSHSNTLGNAYSYAHADSHTFNNSDALTYCDSYTDAHACHDADTPPYTITQAPPNPATSTLARSAFIAAKDLQENPRMIERTSKNIRAHTCPTPPSGNGAARWVAAIFVLSVSLAILPLPRAYGQPGSDANNQTKQGLPGGKVPPVLNAVTPRPDGRPPKATRGNFFVMMAGRSYLRRNFPGDSITLKT